MKKSYEIQLIPAEKLRMPFSALPLQNESIKLAFFKPWMPLGI